MSNWLKYKVNVIFILVLFIIVWNGGVCWPIRDLVRSDIGNRLIATIKCWMSGILGQLIEALKSGNHGIPHQHTFNMFWLKDIV